MDFIQEDKGNVQIISMKSDLVADNVSDLKEALAGLLAAEKKNIVIDMGGMNYIDSSGLAALISKLNEFRKKKGDVRLASMNNTVRNIFDVTFLSSLFKIYPSVDEDCKDF